MKKVIFFLAIFFISQNAISQSLIAVQNGGTPSFYSDLGNAIDNAVDGDTIYIPGRSYTLNKTINKRLHLVGTGINPNSTTATGITSISSSDDSIPQITLGDNADGGSITGIRFTSVDWDNINIPAGEVVSNYNISRCSFDSNIYGQFSNSLFKQNIIFKAYIISVNSGSLFSNNLVRAGAVNVFENVTISNNIFLFGSTWDVDLVVDNCLVENNILHYSFNYSSLSSSSNFFRNNLNVNNGNHGTNIRNGNFAVNVELDTIFENFSGSSSEAINFTADFNLPDSSPYKNAGADGTDIGIYGGRFPWKDGSAPFNPQIIFKDIEGNTDANGNIQVEIHVEAQGN